ncbi:MAG: hypothetical protein LLG04_02010 [Parachlamydia sp.]|nr:hypothetical protein [Parachlamydia sp.]
MDTDKEQEIDASTLKSICYWCVAMLCIIFSLFGIVHSGTETSSPDEEQEQNSENSRDSKNKQIKRGGFGNAARRRSGWGNC